MSGLVTVEEAAELVGVSVRTVRRWVSTGLLSSVAMRGRAALFLDRHVYEADLHQRRGKCQPRVS